MTGITESGGETTLVRQLESSSRVMPSHAQAPPLQGGVPRDPATGQVRASNDREMQSLASPADDRQGTSDFETISKSQTEVNLSPPFSDNTGDMFCPEDIFESLDKYFSLVQELNNISKSDLRSVSFSTRTIGIVTITNNAESKNIQIVRDSINLYSAYKNDDNWEVDSNLLQPREISIILHLPNNKEQLLSEFYGRQLTFRLKELFQAENYPINQKISFHNAQVPYYFCISDESNRQQIIFLGFDLEQQNIFKSYFYPDRAVFTPINSLPISHLNQLTSGF